MTCVGVGEGEKKPKEKTKKRAEVGADIGVVYCVGKEKRKDPCPDYAELPFS